MKKIPRAAMPVVREIRKHVERPQAMPTWQKKGMVFRWWRARIGYKGTLHRRRVWPTCPMGMLPYASVNTPVFSSDFDLELLTDKAITSFFVWFDSLTAADAAAAMDAIWGKE